MKYLSSIISTMVLCLFFSCDEIGPSINPVGTGGGNGVQDRRVLIEEFTGVRCVNCPAGSATIENLIGIHEDQLIAVSLHAGFFSDPYSQSTQDFNTAEGDNLESLLGPVNFYPASVVNRQLFTAENQLPLEQTKWAGYISEELQTAPKVNVTIDKSYDTGTRQLTVTVDLLFNETVDEPVSLTVLLTENNVVNAQLTPESSSSSPDVDYVHKHVLRRSLSNFSGDPLTGSTVIGSTLTKTFTTTLPDLWVDGNVSVVAFAHLDGSVDGLDVLQAAEAKVN